MDYYAAKVAWALLLSLVLVIIIIPFACFVYSKITNGTWSFKNRVTDSKEANIETNIETSFACIK